MQADSISEQRLLEKIRQLPPEKLSLQQQNFLNQFCSQSGITLMMQNMTNYSNAI